ncbi:MAG: 50S ribosomal protein L10 [Candidatus Omnitrophota bacterium]|jgi:large subunit ribosomal protein L10
MKKLGLLVKEISENRVKGYLKDSNSVFILKYSGLSSPDMTSLRQALIGINANFFVVKNSVARRALKEHGLEELIKSIEGPCGFVFAKDEPVGVCKALCGFAKEHEKLGLEGGFFQERLLDNKEIEAISKLPSKETLRAQAVLTLKSPITNIVMVLSATLKKFVCCLDQIKQKKGTQ